MCFKITLALREYYRYTGLSAKLEERGFGSSRPELAWANRIKHLGVEESTNRQEVLPPHPESLNHPDSN